MIKVPVFLTKKSEIHKFLLFVAFFALIFIAIYKPFGSMRWIDGLNFDTYFFYTAILVLVGFILLYISRMALYYVQKRHNLHLNSYITWLIGEIVVIAFGCSLAGFFINDDKSVIFIQILPRTFLYTVSILFIPYVVCWLYYAMLEKERALQKLIQQNPSAIDSLNALESSNDLVKFYDNKKQLCLSVKLEQLLYVESFDNYVKIYYKHQNSTNVFVLRNSISNIEKEYGSLGLVRCHRSFLVNFNKIKVIRKEKNVYKISLEEEGTPMLPVSKTYLEHFLKLMS